MILDNENKNLKVHEWITKYTVEGKLNIVTGYFTVGALAYISQKVNEKIDEFNLVLGDIVNISQIKDRTLDLLNENITIEAALKLSSLSKEAVSFLKQDKVKAKTLEPNFCHAKVYIFESKDNDVQKDYYISGSSNLTEAGIGLKQTHNIELNSAEFGACANYKELAEWFDDLWKKPQAHSDKTLIDENGKSNKVPFKQYLIEEIQKIFIEYTPKELYYKVLFELFGKQILLDWQDPDFNRQIGKLENTVIYKALYEFQQKGVLSLIQMLQKYNGAILADAVGLGKTWVALAIMKFFQMQGRETILICPKKLHHNWLKYQKNQESKFEKDQLDYFIRFHTDLQPERLERYRYIDRADTYFQSDKPKLFVIDESHNLRNDKSERYKFLVEEMLRKNGDVKVLMLSATPINNTLIDIRNQFKLIVGGRAHGFADSLGIKNIDYTFREAQKAFNEWIEDESPRIRIGDLIKKLPDDFFKLTDSLTVARTRKMIEGYQNNLHFPQKAVPENIFITPKQIGNFESFEELFNHFPPMLSGYQPARYIEQAEDIDALRDEKLRDFFLVKMMYILMTKRLESSWYAFHSTVNKIREHHLQALCKIRAYQKLKKDEDVEVPQSPALLEDEDFYLGKKRKIMLSEIDAAGNLDAYKKDLKKDIKSLRTLKANLDRFEKQIEKENKTVNNHRSVDDKLEALIKKIQEKRRAGNNNNNQKVIVFTAYQDTAEYLFNQLKARGFNKIAMVSGDISKTDDSQGATKNFEHILERFTPFTKLFVEKEWKRFQPSDASLPLKQQYQEWQEWIADNDSKIYEKLQNPIDILIATDTLSEGQNLQDCDMVINYDIHWNPVRVIQRMGRIDRLGSFNDIIYGVNFWPSNNINTYLNLQTRVEQRMAAMKLAGSQVPMEFTETFKEMSRDEELERKQKERMLNQMQTTWEDIEVSEQGLGFDDLSLERYRQDLLEELKKQEKKYRDMPKGVYTGFKKETSICPEEGIIAFLGYPSKPTNVEDAGYKTYELIYIDKEGRSVLINQKEVLDALKFHQDKPRYVPTEIDKGEEAAIKALADSVKEWLKMQAVEEEQTEDGSIKTKMGSSAKDILSKLKIGDKDAITRIKQNKKVEDKFKAENFDLITWFLVR